MEREAYLCPRISQKIWIGIGDYILLMKDGRIVWDLQIEEVRERYLIVYGTKEEIEQFRQGKVIYRSFGEYKNYAFIKKDMNIDYGGYRTNTAFTGRSDVLPGEGRIRRCIE